MAKIHWLPRLFLIWSLSAFVTFCGMLFHQSDTPTFFGRYSTAVLAMLIGLALGTLLAAAIGFALHAKPRWRERVESWLASRTALFSWAVLAAAASLLSGMWIFFLGNHLPTYGLLRAFLGISLLVGALLLVGRGSAIPVDWRLLLVIGIGLLVVLGVLTVAFHPGLAKTDEAEVFSRARNLLETGHDGPSIYRFLLAQDHNIQSGIWTRMLAGWLRLAGISLYSGRLYFLLLGFAGVGFLWLAASNVYDRLTAWFVALLGVFSVMGLTHIRFDGPTAFFLSLAIFFYSVGQKRQDRWWVHFLAGLSVGLCLDSTPIAYCFCIGFGLFYFFRYVREIRSTRNWRWRPFWLVAAGEVVAAILYLATRAGSSFLVGGGTPLNAMGASYLTIIAQNVNPAHVVEALGSYFTAFLTSQPILFALLACGIVLALVRRQTSDRFLLILYFVWLAAVVTVYYYFPVFYLVHGLPIMLLLSARTLSDGLPRLLGLVEEPVRLIKPLTILLTIWFLIASIQEIRSPQTLRDVVAVGEDIAKIVPPKDVIVAAEPYYFGMLDHEQFVGGAIEAGMQSLRGITPAETWKTVAPDAVVFSSGWSTEPGKTPALLAYMDANDFLMLRCWLSAEFGKIELWVRKSHATAAPDDQCKPKQG